MNYEFTTRNIERVFKTEVVASFVEVCYFGGFDYYEIFEFASFITGEDINAMNISKYRNIILNVLKEEYPELERHIFLCTGEVVNSDDLTNYLQMYKEKYGDYMKVKSIKKETVPQLILK